MPSFVPNFSTEIFGQHSWYQFTQMIMYKSVYQFTLLTPDCTVHYTRRKEVQFYSSLWESNLVAAAAGKNMVTENSGGWEILLFEGNFFHFGGKT